MEASIALYSSFVAVCLVVLGMIIWSLARWASSAVPPGTAALALSLLLLVSAGLAQSGVLLDFSLPPKIMIVLLATTGLSLWLSFGSLGTALIHAVPLWFIVALNSFRWPLELVMHLAYVEGVMPVQLSYSGRNYDILTGILAVVVAALLKRGRAPKWLPAVWNAVGFLLLINVVSIAVLSMPLPFRSFHNEPAATWVAHAPFVWLPLFLVQVALCSHILVWRALRRDAASTLSA